MITLDTLMDIHCSTNFFFFFLRMGMATNLHFKYILLATLFHVQHSSHGECNALSTICSLSGYNPLDDTLHLIRWHNLG